MKLEKKVVSSIIFIFIYMIYSFFLMKYFYNNDWLISAYNVTYSNIKLALLSDFLGSLLIVIIIIFILAIEKKSFYLSGTNKNGKRLAWGLFIVYVGMFIIQGDYSISGIYPCFFYLVVVAFSEEFIFRGYLFTELEKEIPTYLAVIISGAMWGAMHAFLPAIIKDYSIIQFLNAILSQIGGGIIAGAMFTWLYKKSNSLILPIIVHALLDYCPVLFK
jgi:membrane protease YdiL (CAAX protease family)